MARKKLKEIKQESQETEQTTEDVSDTPNVEEFAGLEDLTEPTVLVQEEELLEETPKEEEETPQREKLPAGAQHKAESFKKLVKPTIPDERKTRKKDTGVRSTLGLFHR